MAKLLSKIKRGSAAFVSLLSVNTLAQGTSYQDSVHIDKNNGTVTVNNNTYPIEGGITEEQIHVLIDASERKAGQHWQAEFETFVSALSKQSAVRQAEVIKSLTTINTQVDDLKQKLQTEHSQDSEDAAEKSASLNTHLRELNDKQQEILDAIVKEEKAREKDKLLPRPDFAGGLGFGVEYDAFFRGSHQALGTVGITGHPTFSIGHAFAIAGGSLFALDEGAGFTYDLHWGLLLGSFDNSFSMGVGPILGTDGVNVAAHVPRFFVNAGAYVGPAVMMDASLGDWGRIFVGAGLDFRTNTTSEAEGNLGLLVGKPVNGSTFSFLAGVYLSLAYRAFTRIDASNYSTELGYRVSAY